MGWFNKIIANDTRTGGHEKQTDVITGTNFGADRRALDVYVRNTTGDPIPVTGQFSTIANGPLLVTGETVTATSASFPTTNQVDRISVSIRNIDTVESVWIVNSSGISKATAGVDIWEIGPNESFNTDLNDTSSLFLVADAGKSVAIQILEIKG